MLSLATFSSSEDEEEYTIAEVNNMYRELKQHSNIFPQFHDCVPFLLTAMFLNNLKVIVVLCGR